MAHFSTTQRGAFLVSSGVDVGRTAFLRIPTLRPLTPAEADALSALLRRQTDVIARLCADALASSGTHIAHGGLLDPREAARLRPAEVLGAAGPEEPPTWCEQGRAKLLGALGREQGLVRLVGVRSGEATYWVYTDEPVGRYVGGVRVPEGDTLRRLLYGS